MSLKVKAEDSDSFFLLLTRRVQTPLAPSAEDWLFFLTVHRFCLVLSLAITSFNELSDSNHVLRKSPFTWTSCVSYLL